MDREFFVCQCENVSHNFCVTRDSEFNEVSVEIHLCQLSFFKRVWIAIKYIFGQSNNSYENVILSENQIKNLVNQLNK